MKVTKAQREALRRDLAAKGYGVADIAVVMAAKYRVRPRLAWRWAHGRTLQDVADAWNQQDASGRAPMTPQRVSDYERWPDGGRRPTVYVLLRFASIYGASVEELLDPHDYAALNDQQLFEVVELRRGSADRCAPTETGRTDVVAPGHGMAAEDRYGRAEDSADRRHIRADVGHRAADSAAPPPGGRGHRLERGEIQGLAAAGSLSPAGDVPVDAVVSAIEMDRRAEMSDLGAGTLERSQRAVDRLCRDYPTADPARLAARVRSQLGYVGRLLGGRLTLAQHRGLLVVSGWLSVLFGCLQFDLGDRTAADASCDTARRLGHEAGHQEIMAWSFELRAWSALVDERLTDAVDFARAGLQLSGNTFVTPQLSAHEAKAWARRGVADAADAAMARAAASVAKLPTPVHPEHHLVFDATKLCSYASTCQLWLGRHSHAKAQAQEVLQRSTDAAGNGLWPERLAIARVDLGLIAVYDGALDEACDLGFKVLESDRLCATALGRFAELDGLLAKRHGDAKVVQDLHERYLAERRRLGRHASQVEAAGATWPGSWTP